MPGLQNVGLLSIQGQSHLEFRPDPEKCQRWGVQVADVINVAASAMGGQAVTQIVEGEKKFDLFDPLAGMAAQQRIVHPRYSRGRGQ